MSSKPRFSFGGELSRSEFEQVRARIVPDWKKRCKRVPKDALLKAIHNSIPHRLAFEVDRIRGYDYDSGEAGFVYAVLNA